MILGLAKALSEKHMSSSVQLERYACSVCPTRHASPPASQCTCTWRPRHGRASLAGCSVDVAGRGDEPHHVHAAIAGLPELVVECEAEAAAACCVTELGELGEEWRRSRCKVQPWGRHAAGG